MTEEGRLFAYRERARMPGDPVRPVELVKEVPPRSQKVKVRWLDLLVGVVGPVDRANRLVEEAGDLGSVALPVVPDPRRFGHPPYSSGQFPAPAGFLAISVVHTYPTQLESRFGQLSKRYFSAGS
jgi:hypothetical protein